MWNFVNLTKELNIGRMHCDCLNKRCDYKKNFWPTQSLNEKIKFSLKTFKKWMEMNFKNHLNEKFMKIRPRCWCIERLYKNYNSGACTVSSEKFENFFFFCFQLDFLCIIFPGENNCWILTNIVSINFFFFPIIL